MFNNRGVLPKPNLPIVTIPIFKRDHIVLQLAVHGAGLFDQIAILAASLNRIGLVEGKHFYVNKPDVKLYEKTISPSQPSLFWVEFKGSGQVIHAILSHLENAVNVATQVRDPMTGRDTVFADTGFFAKWVDEFLSQYNDDEPIIPAELAQVFAAHERQFEKLREALKSLAKDELMLKAKSEAQIEMMSTLGYLSNMDAAKTPVSVKKTSFVYLLAALCHACKQASKEKIGWFDKNTKDANVFGRYMELFEKFSGLMPADLDPMAKYREWGDITSDEDKVKGMKDAALTKIYNERVLPFINSYKAALVVPAKK